MFGAKRFWVYPAKVNGLFQRVHRVSGTILIGILLLVPWVRIAGQPLFLMDIGARRFFMLGLVFTPRDALLLFLILITAAFTLFFFTAVYGRLWCGFGCPQTVFLEEFVRRIELAIEGDRGPRRKRDEGPWTAEKIRKKALKWSIFAVLAIVLGYSFMGFFDDSYQIWTGRAGTMTYAMGAAFSLIFFLDFAWFREQFCIYLCPYARIQGAMTDDDSIIIGYEGDRGEPRLNAALLKGGKPMEEFGDCVNCDRCVTVCPTGIDIREGFQLECISCARCIDACTEVLGRRNKPTLIKFASENELKGEPQRKLRPRTALYGAINTFAAIVAIVFVMKRPDFDMVIAPVRGGDSEVTAVGAAQNRYELTVFNNTMSERTFSFEVEGLDGASLVVPGQTITLQPTEQARVQAFVIVPRANVNNGKVQKFTIVGKSDLHTLRREATFRFFEGGPHATLANPGIFLSRICDPGEFAPSLPRGNDRRSDRSYL